MVDLSKKYYAVHVQASNFLNGIHYIPFIDEDIEQMQKECVNLAPHELWHYQGECLLDYMEHYFRDKFSYDVLSDAQFDAFADGAFQPVDMPAIINTPAEPRRVEVNINVGEDMCVLFNISEAEEDIKCDDEQDRSIITCAGDAPYNPCIEVYRHAREFPHLNNMIHISNLSVWGIVVEAVIESIERNDNVTVYHCKNSLFPFVVVVTAHQLFWYDDETPIYKE
ncbi:MAG: hypothetical protein J5704_05635 [Paludibacteraceae bacterium]|nr:hypothetical protein [Paludibacteraceae bacterium]